MPKYSVKKPFTILVAVILVLVLGFVSLTGIQTDLLPSMNLPYLLVMTTYPGASPEQVEADVTQPLENSLSTLNGVKNVTSQSNENYSLIFLEYQDDTDMDSAMVKASTAVNQLGDTLPDMASTPTLIEISPDMMATQYIAVDYDGMDIYELSDYVKDTVMPQLERVDGVASVSTTGLVEKTVQITLNQEKIDTVNDKLLVKVSDRLADAKKELDSNKAKINSSLKELDDAQAQLDAGKAELNTQKADVTTQLRDAITDLDKQIPELEKKIASLKDDLDNATRQLEDAKASTVTLPEITLPIDDALFASCKQILVVYDESYNEAEMPANLAEAKSDATKMGAMVNSITRAQNKINQTAKDAGLLLSDTMTVSQAAAIYDAQYVNLTGEIQQLDTEIVALQQQIDTTEDPDEKADLQAKLDEKTAERAGEQTQLEAVNAKREQIAPLNEAMNTLSTTQLALQNAPALIQMRQQAEEAINSSTAPLQQSLNDSIQSLNEQIGQAQSLLIQLNDQRDKLQKMLASLGDEAVDPDMADMAVQLLLSGSEAQLQLGEFQLSSGRTQLEAGKTQLEAAQKEYDSAREEALKNANLDQLLNMNTLKQLIYAQNFSMPAGYIDGGEGDDHRYIIKVGDAFSDADELKSMVLCNIDGIGDVRLSDVADVAMVDNADDAYAKVDKNRAVLLSLYKSSTASTSAVSNASKAAMDTMMAENEGLHLTPIMDQGDYIKLIVNSVLSNLVEGAILAIIVLALFLKDLRPTIVVAISMPLSVLFAIVLMYFTGITFNILSLSGLALGVGMLVDNSVVVIENIYRLRGRGVPAPRASVQGARQVAGSIVSSTLTTICVFMPLVFTTGMVRELLSDMAWTITFSLLASLVVALTVVPCAGSTVLKKQKDIKHPWFDKVLNGYEKLLRFCLRRKAVPLALAIVLLGVSVWRVATMGVVMIPDMSSNQLTITVDVADDTAKEDAFATADAVMDAVMSIDGVDTVGAMSGSSNSMVAMTGSSAATDNTTFTYYVLLDDKAPKAKVIEQEIYDNTADLDCEITVNSNGMMDMSALSGSGIEVDLYGNDLDDLATAGKQVMEVMNGIDGIQNVTDGQDAGEEEVNITIDKDKAMRMGLTVAQVYQQIAAKLTTDTTATTLKAGGNSYNVTIVDETDVPNLDDIFSMEFETTTTDDDGNTVNETHTLGEFATRTISAGYTTISRENGSRILSITSETADGYNTTLLSRELEPLLDDLQLPDGVTAELAGETTQVSEMLSQMVKMLALALVFVYFVMVAQFQSLLSPFIVLFTIPLAFTGGMLGLMATGEQLSLISLMGFLVLMGVVVNNGIVFVDYANQLRIGGLAREDALVATGRTRMRPILMTTLTTVLAMVTMLFGTDMASEMSTGMAIVIIGGLSYATLMTLFIVPVLYDLFYRKPPVNIDVGDDGMDDLPDDAAEFAAEFAARRAAEQGEAPADEKRRPDLSRAAHAPDKPDDTAPEEDATDDN